KTCFAAGDTTALCLAQIVQSSHYHGHVAHPMPLSSSNQDTALGACRNKVCVLLLVRRAFPPCQSQDTWPHCLALFVHSALCQFAFAKTLTTTGDRDNCS